jgi:hypothetical protein
MNTGSTTSQGALGWAAATCLIALLVGLIGYTVGASDRDDAAAQATPPAPAPELIPLAKAYAAGRSEGFRRGKLRAYKEGRFDGLKEGRRAERRRLERRYELVRRRGAAEALRGLDPAGWFLVQTAPNGRELGDLVRLAPEKRYTLCRGGAEVCSVTPRD